MRSLARSKVGVEIRVSMGVVGMVTLGQSAVGLTPTPSTASTSREHPWLLPSYQWALCFKHLLRYGECHGHMGLHSAFPADKDAFCV